MSVSSISSRSGDHAQSADESQMTRSNRTRRPQPAPEEPMSTASQFGFDVYRLDVANAQLWCEAQVLPLTTKALRVLGLLVAHAGQLVSKDTLFQTIWP